VAKLNDRAWPASRSSAHRQRRLRQLQPGLSERRASSVAEYLISQGLAPNKVTSQGRGEAIRLLTTKPRKAARNRRVELHLN
jgi:outer membrane protein OmpA-like peptidoglycan-associated protein